MSAAVRPPTFESTSRRNIVLLAISTWGMTGVGLLFSLSVFALTRLRRISKRKYYFVLAMWNINAILTRTKKNRDFFNAFNCFKPTTGGAIRGERVKSK